MNSVRLTRRGWIVSVLAVITFAIAFNWVMADVCWTGTGYGSCTQAFNTITHNIKENHGNE